MIVSNKSLIAESAIVFTLSLLFVGFLQLYSPGLIGVDGYYHFRISELLAESGPWVDISWLPLTVLQQSGTDHHWLWHVLLVPFTWLPDELGLNAAAIFTASLIPVIVNLVLRQMGVPYAPIFAILCIAASTLMPGRLMMLRAQNLALIFVVLAFLTLLLRKRVALLVIAFLFMQSYHGAIILLPLSILFVAVAFCLRREFYWKEVLPVIGGLALGLIVNPWFPDNIDYFLFHTLFKTDALTPELTGQEWQSVSLGLFALQSLPANLLLLTSLSLWAWMHKVHGRHSLTSVRLDTVFALVITAMFFVLYLFAWRFAEYYVPFAVITSALMIRDLFGKYGDQLRPIYVNLVSGLVFVLALSFGWLGISNTQKTQAMALQNAGQYLQANATAGELVFNSEWSDFVQLFWHTRSVNLVNGLDGHFLAYGDPIKFEQWYTLINLRIGVPSTLSPQQISDIVRESFGSRFALINKRHQALAQFLTASENWIVVAEDDTAWLLRHRDS